MAISNSTDRIKIIEGSRHEFVKEINDWIKAHHDEDYDFGDTQVRKGTNNSLIYSVIIEITD